jgi:hypothetical protein
MLKELKMLKDKLLVFGIEMVVLIKNGEFSIKIRDQSWKPRV